MDHQKSAQAEIFVDKFSRIKGISNNSYQRAKHFEDKYFRGSGNIHETLEILYPRKLVALW